jgi:NitT/TauT family transport system substrate-binding protein
MKPILSPFLGILIFIYLFPIWNQGEAQPVNSSLPMKLALQWSPQSQFAGYYLAQEKGFYRDKGLNVEIVRGGPDVDPMELLQQQKVHFATMFLTGAIAARDRGIPLVNIGQIINHSNLVLVAWRDRNIARIEDLHQRRISIWEGNFRGAFLGLFLGLGIMPDIIPQNYTVNLFLRRGIDACSAMYYNEYHMIYQAGINPEELSVFLLRDNGYDIPEDGIYCLESTLQANPQACRALVEASLEGWEYARQNPEETLDVVMKEVQDAHLPTNRAHMRWMLEKIIPTILPPNTEHWMAGRLTEEGYQRCLLVMKAQVEKSRILTIDKFFRGSFHAP